MFDLFFENCLIFWFWFSQPLLKFYQAIYIGRAMFLLTNIYSIGNHGNNLFATSRRVNRLLRQFRKHGRCIWPGAWFTTMQHTEHHCINSDTWWSLFPSKCEGSDGKMPNLSSTKFYVVFHNHQREIMHRRENELLSIKQDVVTRWNSTLNMPRTPNLHWSRPWGTLKTHLLNLPGRIGIS